MAIPTDRFNLVFGVQQTHGGDEEPSGFEGTMHIVRRNADGVVDETHRLTTKIWYRTQAEAQRAAQIEGDGHIRRLANTAS